MPAWKFCSVWFGLFAWLLWFHMICVVLVIAFQFCCLEHGFVWGCCLFLFNPRISALLSGRLGFRSSACVGGQHEIFFYFLFSDTDLTAKHDFYDQENRDEHVFILFRKNSCIPYGFYCSVCLFLLWSSGLAFLISYEQLSWWHSSVTLVFLLCLTVR